MTTASVIWFLSMTNVFNCLNMLMSGSTLQQHQSPTRQKNGGAPHVIDVAQCKRGDDAPICVCFAQRARVFGGGLLLQVVVGEVELEYPGRCTSVLL